MSLLKKLFGKKPSESEIHDQQQRILRSRSGRVRVLPLHRVAFRLASDPGHDIPVANLSVTGVGLVREPGREWPGVGSVVKAILLLDGSEFTVDLEMVHISENTVGGRLRLPSDEAYRAIKKRFELELAAGTLTEVNPEVLKKEEVGTPHWYLGTNNSELFFVEDGGKVLHFYGSFLGNYFEGGQNRPARFGHVAQEAPGDDRSYSRSEMIRYEKEASPEVVATALKFVQCIQPLDARIRERICSMLARASESTDPYKPDPN